MSRPPAHVHRPPSRRRCLPASRARRWRAGAGCRRQPGRAADPGVGRPWPSSVVQGTIQDAERLVVEGTVEASSLLAQELQIAQGGVLKGQVEVEDAEISGLMDGMLTVRGSLVLRGPGQVIGEARCRRLQVEDGGQLSGKISMIGEAAPAPANATASYMPVEHEAG